MARCEITFETGDPDVSGNGPEAAASPLVRLRLAIHVGEVVRPAARGTHGQGGGGVRARSGLAS